jgi:undecaprenyl diphosphate synthase
MRRSQGHREGVQAVKRVILEAIALGVDHLTVYAFSTENWLREKEEVTFLMKLLAHHLRNEYDFYRKNDVCVRHIGNLDGLPSEVRREITRVVEDTRDNNAVTLNLAVNYGGRDEIVRAFNRWLELDYSPAGDNGTLIDVAELRDHLDLARTPDPDLIVRTGGERRLSNFLLWESAYAELYFSDRLWPEWDGEDLREAVEDFRRRKRTYGRTPTTARGARSATAHNVGADTTPAESA